MSVGAEKAMIWGGGSMYGAVWSDPLLVGNNWLDGARNWQDCDDQLLFQGASPTENEEKLLEHFQFKEKQPENGKRRVLHRRERDLQMISVILPLRWSLVRLSFSDDQSDHYVVWLRRREKRAVQKSEQVTFNFGRKLNDSLSTQLISSLSTHVLLS